VFQWPTFLYMVVNFLLGERYGIYHLFCEEIPCFMKIVNSKTISFCLLSRKWTHNEQISAPSGFLTGTHCVKLTLSIYLCEGFNFSICYLKLLDQDKSTMFPFQFAVKSSSLNAWRSC
jgi:hypothetical protein